MNATKDRVTLLWQIHKPLYELLKKEKAKTGSPMIWIVEKALAMYFARDTKEEET
jgi:hypothetical protein